MQLLTSILPLALLDAVSVGALAMPVWFLISDHVRHRYLCLYLAILAVAYAVLGLAVLNGPADLRDRAQEVVDSAVGDWVRGVVGIVLLLFSAWYGLIHKAGVRAQGAGRLGAWRAAAVGEDASARGAVGLALAATAVEIPTAVPYAIALGRLGEASTGWTTRVGVVGVYATVMILPALALTAGSVLARGYVAGVLHRVDRWFRVNAQENTAWLIAVVGLALLFDTRLYDAMMAVVSDPASAQSRPLE